MNGQLVHENSLAEAFHKHAAACRWRKSTAKCRGRRRFWIGVIVGNSVSRTAHICY